MRVFGVSIIILTSLVTQPVLQVLYLIHIDNFKRLLFLEVWFEFRVEIGCTLIFVFCFLSVKLSERLYSTYLTIITEENMKITA